MKRALLNFTIVIIVVSTLNVHHSVTAEDDSESLCRCSRLPNYTHVELFDQFGARAAAYVDNGRIYFLWRDNDIRKRSDIYYEIGGRFDVLNQIIDDKYLGCTTYIDLTYRMCSRIEDVHACWRNGQKFCAYVATSEGSKNKWCYTTLPNRAHCDALCHPSEPLDDHKVNRVFDTREVCLNDGDSTSTLCDYHKTYPAKSAPYPIGIIGSPIINRHIFDSDISPRPEKQKLSCRYDRIGFVHPFDKNSVMRLGSVFYRTGGEAENDGPCVRTVFSWDHEDEFLTELYSDNLPLLQSYPCYGRAYRYNSSGRAEEPISFLKYNGRTEVFIETAPCIGDKYNLGEGALINFDTLSEKCAALDELIQIECWKLKKQPTTDVNCASTDVLPERFDSASYTMGFVVAKPVSELVTCTMSRDCVEGLPPKVRCEAKRVDTWKQWFIVDVWPRVIGPQRDNQQGSFSLTNAIWSPPKQGVYVGNYTCQVKIEFFIPPFYSSVAVTECAVKVLVEETCFPAETTTSPTTTLAATTTGEEEPAETTEQAEM